MCGTIRKQVFAGYDKGPLVGFTPGLWSSVKMWQENDVECIPDTREAKAAWRDVGKLCSLATKLDDKIVCHQRS